MTSDEKFKYLLALNDKASKIKVTTANGATYYCVIDSPAEGEDEWAYHFISPDYPTKYFILECEFIENIEEISEEEWQQHLANQE